MQAFANHGLNSSQLGFGYFRALFVQIDGKAALVGDGQIGAGFVAHGGDSHRVAAVAEMTLQAAAGFAARGKHRQGFASEGVNHLRSVDAAPARRFPGGEDVRAILKSQMIYADDAVDGRINRKSDNQYSILRRIGTPCGTYAFDDSNSDQDDDSNGDPAPRHVGHVGAHGQTGDQNTKANDI